MYRIPSRTATRIVGAGGLLAIVGCMVTAVSVWQAPTLASRTALFLAHWDVLYLNHELVLLPAVGIVAGAFVLEATLNPERANKYVHAMLGGGILLLTIGVLTAAVAASNLATSPDGFLLAVISIGAALREATRRGERQFWQEASIVGFVAAAVTSTWINATEISALAVEFDTPGAFVAGALFGPPTIAVGGMLIVFGWIRADSAAKQAGGRR